VPAMLPAIIEATKAVRDPATGRSVYDRWREQSGKGNIRSYAVSGATAGPVPFGVLGGGSDFMVFLQHEGIPSLDMIFDGPYGVYHSVYDDYDWMARFGDPGFHYHAAMSRLWGLVAMRFADADLLPFDYAAYATEVQAYLGGLENAAPPEFVAQELKPLIQKCDDWKEAASQINARLEAWRRGDSAGIKPEAIDQLLLQQERALLAEQGIPGRPWFRHLIYAPLPSYEAETLPGLREALEQKDLARAHEQALILGKAVDGATAIMRQANQQGK
jgi:N-acetylated-alpha-linked acidic dipeptidase